MNAQLSSTGLILGGDFSNTYYDKYGGAAGDYAVTLGGESNFALGNISVIAGGYGNHASGKLSFIGGGNNNVATGSYSANLGGTGNTASGESSVVTGGAYNTASGTKSFVGGGHGNIAVGGYSAVIGGWDNRAFGDPNREIIATVVGGYRNTANGYHAMVTGGYQNVAWGRDTLVSGGRYNTVLGEMEDGWTDQHLSDASAFGGEGSVVQGLGSVGLAGGSTGKTAYLALAAGYQSVVTDGAAKLEANFSDYEILPVYKDIASAIGYQSTANEAGTISFGHDAGDVSGYTVNWEEDKDPTHDTIDYGSNDYTKTPTVTENYYDDAYYNRLVKVADGIDNHDAVTREQVQYIGGIYGTDKNDSNYGGRGATGTNSVAIGSNAVATEDNVVSFGNPDIPAVNIPESRKITHSVSLSDTDKTAINNVLGFDVTNDENWSKISGLKDLVIVNSLGSATDAQDRQKLANNPEFMELLNKVNTAILNGTLTSEQWISFEKYANGTEVETTDAVNIPAKAANYRRVVNMADGINPHDAVAMEQLEDYAKTDASNIGNSNENKDDWGEALGVDSLTTADAASNSNQLITGKTLYSYDKPNADGTYVKLNQTTGQNLSALDTQVKANTDALTKPNHNIKYYAVDETTLPKLTNFNGKDYSNEKNNGAKGMGSIAAGFNTHADGIISTVAGSYSGVIGTGLQGATALSYGTFNVNQNTDSTKAVSGVANSIIGQANVTTDSNAAIIYGAGNTVTNSYRDIDTSKVNLNKVKQDLKNKDVAAVIQDAQKAVPASGGQVMVMGGGNNVESAYMTQVVGVGNTVKGNQVQNDKSEWVTDKSIKDYDPEKSSQYNYVDGFSNEVINGKHDYVIGANNTVTGDSYDDKDAKKYSNESNIIFGDNHTVTNTKNAVIIGSSDTQMTLDQGDRATAIGYNASAQRDALAVGVNTQARGNAVALGTYSTAHNNSIAIGTKATAVSSQNLAIGWEAHIGNIKTDDEKIKNAIALGSDSQVRSKDLLESDNSRGVLSIGDKDKERRIIHVRAGVNDTDAVNVSQLKSAQTDLTDKGLIFAANEGSAHTAKLGDTVTIQGTAKKENHEYTADNLTTEIDGSGNITILMDKDMSVEKLAVNGKDGKDGQPGTPGSIGIKGQDGDAGIGIDGKNGISIKGTDGKDGVTIKAVNGKDGTEGHIGLTGPAGTNGMDGADGKPGNSIDITVKNGYNVEGKDGINGENGVDGTSLTRIVYKDATGEHQIATMEDGLKFKGDDGKEIAKKLNNTMEIIGGADSKNLTDGNISVNSTDKGQLKVQLAKDLKGITSISNQTTTKDGDKDVTTGATIILGTDGTTTITGGDVNVGGNKVTNIKSALAGVTDANGKDATIATAPDDALKNAVNLGDLQNVYKEVNSKADKASASHTALTVEGGKAAGTEKGSYNGENILLHATKDKDTGKVTYDLKLNNNIMIGNKGKDGVSITGPNGEDGIDGKVGISGKDGKDAVSITGKGGVGHIGLTGPAGTNGMKGADGQPGASIDITVKNGYNEQGKDGKDGINGEKGVDSTSLTRVVYTDKTGEHQIATMEDGLKFKGDDGKEISKKLNNTLEITGGAKGELTEGNIGVVSENGKLNVKLAKDLTGLNSTTYTTKTGEEESATTSTTVVNGNGLTINNGPSITNNGIDGGKKTITNVGSGIEAGTDGKYTVTDANKSNAANIGDVNNMVNQAVDKLSNDTKTDLAGKANVNANNVGANISGSVEEKETNEKAWASAIGTGNIDNPKDMLITDTAVHNEVRPTEDGNYVKTSQTTGQNLTALDSKIGKLDENTKYNYIDAGKNVSISDNLTKLDTQVKKNADAIQKNSEDIQNITNNVKNLSDNAVQYDKDSNKTKVTLGGEGGTTITNVKDGALDDKSTDAVNGKQLYSEQQAREKADKEINEKVTNNTTAITELKDLSNITDNGKNVIRNLAKGSVKVIAGTNTTVTEGADGDAKTYAVNVEGNGKVESGNTGLISGGTAYTELRPADGTYVKQASTTAANLTALDKGLKTTSDLIHTNTAGDTIQIGGNSKATKIDVSGKDANGNTTGRVITGVVSDANDPNSAANVGYVNGLTAANTQQIYRDMNNAYSRLDTNINRAAAGSNALAALHPLDYDPADKASFAVGYGHYHNANAAAVGAFYQPNANTMVNMGISLGNGDPGFNAGISFKIGKGSTYNGVSKAEMAQTIHDQAAEISTIKANDAAKDKRIDALEKENQEMKKQIQEILARLNG